MVLVARRHGVTGWNGHLSHGASYVSMWWSVRSSSVSRPRVTCGGKRTSLPLYNSQKDMVFMTHLLRKSVRSSIGHTNGKSPVCLVPSPRTPWFRSQ